MTIDDWWKSLRSIILLFITRQDSFNSSAGADQDSAITCMKLHEESFFVDQTGRSAASGWAET